MTGAELLKKATKAADDYHAVYGKFPVQIGIHLSQIGLLPPSYFFVERPPMVSLLVTETLDIRESVPYTRCEVRFEPVMGPDIQLDEVYVSPPSNPFKVFSGSILAKVAKEFERD